MTPLWPLLPGMKGKELRLALSLGIPLLAGLAACLVIVLAAWIVLSAMEEKERKREKRKKRRER